MQPITIVRAEAFPIGELSRQTGVHIETIRYYERIKMLAAPPRTEGGRRAYDKNHIRRLAFIRRARDMGFTLEEIRTLLDLGGPERASCVDVQKVAVRHLESVRAKLADLAKLETILAETVVRCSGNLTPVCPVLDILDAGQAS